MNGKYRHQTAEKNRDRSFLLRLILLAAFFFAGVILGQVLSGKVSSSMDEELRRYLNSYFSISDEATVNARTTISALIIYFRYPLLAFLLGFASVGLFLLPVLTMVYGFFLSFSVCCFTAVFGSNGVLLALSVFGLRCLITLPCYFFLAVPAFRNAASLAAVSFGRGTTRQAQIHYGTDWWIHLCVIFVILLSGAMTELFFSPHLLHFVLERILS